MNSAGQSNAQSQAADDIQTAPAQPAIVQTPNNTSAQASEYQQVIRDEHYKLAGAPAPTLSQDANTVTEISPAEKVEVPVYVAEKIEDIDMELQEMLSFTIEKNASDLHMAVGFPPMIRLAGKLVPIHNEDLTEKSIEKLISGLIKGRLKEEFDANYDVDFSFAHVSGNRFRVNIFRSKGQLAGAFRLIPSKIRSIAELGLPEVCYELINVPQGLILFTGPTGSGKSTSIAALMQEININTEKHIITIEDPIEYVLPRSKALVNQREIGMDTVGWTRALREILRQDPNIVLVGEMRDHETIAATMTIAETGHLVFSTLHTNSASQSIDRIIDVFPQGQQNQIRSQLANVITAIIAQRLIPVKQGGRKAIFEVMVATPAIKNAIRENKTFQVDNMIQTSAEVGMITLEKSLFKLIKAGEINVEDALTYTAKPDELMSLLNNN